MKKLNELKVLIVGLGQIGGSIGLDLVGNSLVAEVVGIDKNPSISRKAVRQKVIHRAAESMEEEIKKSDLVILAAPIREIIGMIPTVCQSIRQSAAILDTAGTKSMILEAVSKCGRRVNYIGGHPMAGDEGSGLESAHAGKFVGRTFILTPAEETDQDWFYTIMHLITRLRAKPVIMSAEEHDRLIALTSHLPYALSLALLNTVANQGVAKNGVNHLIGGSFRSATRVAGSSPDLIQDMFLTNRANLTSALDEMISQLSNLREILESGGEELLKAYIEVAQKMWIVSSREKMSGISSFSSGLLAKAPDLRL